MPVNQVEPIPTPSRRAPQAITWSLAGLLVISLMGFAFIPDQEAQVVQTQRIELVDSAGTVFTTLTASPVGLRISLYTGSELLLQPNGALVLRDPGGQELIRLGSPMMRPTNKP